MYAHDPESSELSRSYLICQENKVDGKLNVLVKSFSDLEGQWARIDPEVDLRKYSDVWYYSISDSTIQFSMEDDSRDELVSIFFDLISKRLIYLDHGEVYLKLGINLVNDHPESYKIKQSVLGRKGDKVLFRIVKRQNIKHKIKGWDDTIGYYDSHLLQLELDF